MVINRIHVPIITRFFTDSAMLLTRVGHTHKSKPYHFAYKNAQNIKILIQVIKSKALNIQKHVIELRKKNVITKMIKYELALTSYLLH